MTQNKHNHGSHHHDHQYSHQEHHHYDHEHSHHDHQHHGHHHSHQEHHHYGHQHVHQGHHHHHEHDHDHHNDHGDDYQNEFDIYPEEFISLWSDPGLKGKVLDIRDELEREQIQLVGSISIPMNKIAQAVDQLDPEETYFIVCSQGIRSSFASRYLLSEGYKHIYNIQTGIFGIYEYARDQGLSLEWLQVANGWDLQLK